MIYTALGLVGANVVGSSTTVILRFYHFIQIQCMLKNVLIRYMKSVHWASQALATREGCVAIFSLIHSVVCKVEAYDVCFVIPFFTST